MSLKKKVWLALLILLGVYIGRNIYYYKFAFPLGSRDGKGNLYPIFIVPQIKGGEFQKKCLEYKQANNKINFGSKLNSQNFRQLITYTSEGVLTNKCSQNIEITRLGFESKLGSENAFSSKNYFPNLFKPKAEETRRHMLFENSYPYKDLNGYSSVKVKLIEEIIQPLKPFIVNGEIWEKAVPNKDDSIEYRLSKGDKIYSVDIDPRGNIDWRDLADKGLARIYLSVNSPHGKFSYLLENNNCIRFWKKRNPLTSEKIELSCTSPKWQIKTKRVGLIKNEFDIIDSFDLNKLYTKPYQENQLDPSELE